MACKSTFTDVSGLYLVIQILLIVNTQTYPHDRKYHIWTY